MTSRRASAARRQLLPCALALWWLAVAGSAATAAERETREPRRADEPTVDFRFDLEASRFSGDFGAGEEIRYDTLTTRLRWRWQRVELRLGLPYVRLEGDASLVGGSPTPGAPTPPIDTPEPPGTPRAPLAAAPIGPSGTGAGDVDARLDVDLLAGTTRSPWITALGRVKLPTADETKGLGTGETDLEGGILFFQPVGRIGLFLEGRYTWMGDPPDVDFRDVVRASIGISSMIGASRRGQVYAFWESRTHPVPGLEARRDLMVGAGTRIGARGRLRLSGGVYRGFSETAEDWGTQFTLGREF